VIEVFAFEDDARAASVGTEAGHLGDDRGPAGIGTVKLGELLLEQRVCLRGRVGGIQLVERPDERFRHKSPAVFTEVRAEFVTQCHGSSTLA